MSHQHKSYRYWWDYVSEAKGTFVLGALWVAITGAMQVAETRLIGLILDLLDESKALSLFGQMPRLKMFWILCGLFVAARFVMAIARVGWRMTLARETHVVSALLRKKIWDHARFFKLSDFHTIWSKGELLNLVNSDVNSARFIFGLTLVAFFDVLFLAPFILFAMILIHPGLAFASLAVLLLLPFLVRKLSKIEVEKYEQAQQKLTALNDIASQAIATIRLQRLSHVGMYWREKLEEAAEKARAKRLESVNISLRYFPLMGVASLVTYLVIFVMGISFVQKGIISIGDFVAMQGLAFLLQDPLLELGIIISEWKRGLTSLERLIELFEFPQDKDVLKKESLEAAAAISEQAMAVENVWFQYQDDKNGRYILEGLNFNLGENQRLGITGPVGSGKSSFVKLASRMESLEKGQIKIFGRPLSGHSNQELREAMAVVSQRPFLFAQSIRENLCLDRSYSDDEILRALEICQLHEDVASFPSGLDTGLGEWGINLSGGQKQRLTLARALLRRPKILLLDDCLSAVDTVTEEKILSALDQYLKETSLIWIAHRRSTLKYCHQIIEFTPTEQEVSNE